MELPFIFVHPTRIHYNWFHHACRNFQPLRLCIAYGAGITSIVFASMTVSKVSNITWLVNHDGLQVVKGTRSPMLRKQPELRCYCRKRRETGCVKGAAVSLSRILVYILNLATMKV